MSPSPTKIPIDPPNTMRLTVAIIETGRKDLMTPKLKRLIVILPVIVVLVVLGTVYFALQTGAVKSSSGEQSSAAAPVEAAPVQENGTAMAPAADETVSPEKTIPPSDAKVAPFADGTAVPAESPKGESQKSAGKE